MNPKMDVAVSGLLLCKTYDRSGGQLIPQFGQSKYFIYSKALPIMPEGKWTQWPIYLPNQIPE